MTSIPSPRYVLCLIIMLISSCSPRTEESSHSFRVFEENGISVAETRGGPLFEGEIFRYEAILTLDPDPSVPESYLNRVGAAVIDKHGYFYVCERSGRRIAVFDPSGAYVRSFGRRGSGPGEFQSIALIGWSDHELILFDSMLRRVTQYSTEGILSDIYTLSSVSGVRRFYPTGENRFVVFDTRSEYRGTDSWMAMMSLVLGSEGDTISIQQPSLQPHQRSIRGEVEVGFSWYFSAYSRFFYQPGRGLLVSDAESPDLEWFTLSGELTSRIDVGLPRRPVTAREKNTIRDYYDSRIASTRGQQQLSMKAVRDNLAFGEFVPYWVNIMTDDVGYYWLEIYETYQQKQAAGGTAFRVLSNRGEYLGDTRWPAQIPPSSFIEYPVITRGCLVAMVTDPETEEQILTVFRIVPQAEGLRYPRS